MVGTVSVGLIPWEGLPECCRVGVVAWSEGVSVLHWVGRGGELLFTCICFWG